MPLADHDTQTPRRPTGLPCSVQALMDGLDEADRATFHSWMYERGYSQEVIYKMVTAEGHSVAKQTINRHRSRSCRCYQ